MVCRTDSNLSLIEKFQILKTQCQCFMAEHLLHLLLDINQISNLKLIINFKHLPKRALDLDSNTTPYNGNRWLDSHPAHLKMAKRP